MTLFATLPPNACSAYVNLRNAVDGWELAGREHCNDLWREFAPHADRHFVAEFPVHLHERWFEMYLTVALIRTGLNVQCPKPGPDILVTDGNGTRIWIEATCATPGTPDLPDSVPPPRDPPPGGPPIVTERPTAQMILRIRSALSAKEAAFRDYLNAGIVTARDVCAIAINVHAVHGLWADMGDLFMRSLYGVGDLALTLDRHTGAVVGRHHQQLTHVAKRSTGAPVGVLPFVDGGLPHISSVIGSRADAVNLPRRLGDDLAFFPNLTSSIGWPNCAVMLGEEWAFTQGNSGWDGQRASHVL